MAVTLFLLQLSFAWNQTFYFNIGQKLQTHSLFSYTWFCYYRKHPDNNNKICLLPSSACFWQHFHDWFFVLRYNSDLVKLAWTLAQWTSAISNSHRTSKKVRDSEKSKFLASITRWVNLILCLLLYWLW